MSDLVVVEEVGATVVIQEVSAASIVEVVAVGPQGTPGTMAVGTVQTGAPGTSVVITNTGVPTAAVLNFTIPRGEVGDVTPEALAAKAAAETAATNAAASQSAAATSATAAGTSAGQAVTSATNAAASASTASTKASDASSSATSAASSANSASASASTASTKASEASSSANSASTSASTATTKASDASTSATNAAGSASTATTQATQAQSSAAAASSSASSASSSATAAANSATAAAGSATTASNQAATATTQALNAASSANASASNAALAQDWATKTSGEVVSGQGYGAKKYANDASASASSATTSASNASSYSSSAATSASNAASSATSASGSATTATTKASEAATSATNAASSATSAAGSATTATTKAGEASTSATNAATSATNSASSATSASTSAAAATTKASEAASSAASASTSATNAASSATTASTQATNAASSATAAAGSATSAAGNATTATTQAANASTSATNAANSATSAANSATSASGSATTVSGLLASFRQVFLGAFASDSAAVSFASANSITLTDGTMYENTTSTPNKFRIYDGAAWIDYDASAQASQSAAGVSAANAAASASAAAGSESAAATSAANAATSATSSATSATNAASSATAAASSATSAAGSATTATTQASNASASATSAAASATSAANSAAAAAVFGVPAGGTAGQVLSKTDATNYNTQWIDNFATDIRVLVKNSTGATLTKGTAVYISGANGTNILVSKSQANAESTSSKTFGLLLQDLANNEAGYVVCEGTLSGIDTSAAVANDPVWLSPTTAGGLVFGLANKPVAPYHMVYLGIVSRSNASNGAIQVKVQNGYEINELHDVLISSAATDDFFVRAADGLWKNRQLVSSDITTALGFTPYSAANPSGFITSSALSPYLTSAAAASTYQTLSGMSSYLTSAGAASTYLPLAGGSLSGNLDFSGANRRITGDFTSTSRVLVQTTSANSNTVFGLIPNGTAVNSQFHVWGASDITNAPLGAFTINSASVQIQSSAAGTGTVLPFRVLVSTTEVFRASTGFNFLIGTTTDNGTDKLQVTGGASVSGSLTLGGDIQQANATYLKGKTAAGTATRLFGVNSGNNLYIGGIDTTLGDMLFVNNGSELMRLTTTGLGIGTSSPAYKLDIAGATYARLTTTTYSNGGFINARTALSGGTYNTFDFIEGSTTTAYLRNYGSIYGGSVDSHLRLWNTQAAPITFGTSDTERMRLDASGRLQLGTTSANGILTVLQAAGKATFDSNGSYFTIELASGGSRRAFYGYNEGTGQWQLSNVTAGGVEQSVLLYDKTGAYLSFGTNGSERARIDSSGRFLVGSTSVPADTKCIYTYHANSGVNMNMSNCGTASGTAYHWTFLMNSAEVGSIRTTSTTTSYVTSSDYRLKNTIAPMTGALAFVRKQRPVTYKWKADGSEGAGYIAHWMQEDGAGQCVTGTKDAVDAEGNPKYQGIDTSFMVAPLNAAINELADMFDALKAEFDAYKASHP